MTLESGQRLGPYEVLGPLGAGGFSTFALTAAAHIHGLARDRAQALAKAHEERSTWMAYLRLDPRLDPLHGQTRFEELVRRVGLAA